MDHKRRVVHLTKVQPRPASQTDPPDRLELESPLTQPTSHSHTPTDQAGSFPSPRLTSPCAFPELSPHFSEAYPPLLPKRLGKGYRDSNTFVRKVLSIPLSIFAPPLLALSKRANMQKVSPLLSLRSSTLSCVWHDNFIIGICWCAEISPSLQSVLQRFLLSLSLSYLMVHNLRAIEVSAMYCTFIDETQTHLDSACCWLCGYFVGSNRSPRIT